MALDESREVIIDNEIRCRPTANQVCCYGLIKGKAWPQQLLFSRPKFTFGWMPNTRAAASSAGSELGHMKFCVMCGDMTMNKPIDSCIRKCKTMKP